MTGVAIGGTEGKDTKHRTKGRERGRMGKRGRETMLKVRSGANGR